MLWGRRRVSLCVSSRRRPLVGIATRIQHCWFMSSPNGPYSGDVRGFLSVLAPRHRPLAGIMTVVGSLSSTNGLGTCLVVQDLPPMGKTTRLGLSVRSSYPLLLQAGVKGVIGIVSQPRVPYMIEI
ncbi:hypothetical protein K435DRAFT_964424 [Dendrothele bispora CBS 962.96]|uniref:Uncharacterized protein n=1 Tax=Dendrothele bispora (strain CBS 962.96) TaxID=1314807 RepID=A0A4S8MAH8_DENBC|nr:hypothetical protein K435DRAFT_964424 [Dendrothele bispora CBS 962.96]